MGTYKANCKMGQVSLKDLWHNWSVPILSLAGTSLSLFILKNNGILKIAYSKSMSSALDAVMTFTSIILGFMGVLLTTFASMKGKSSIIQFFLASVNKRYFLKVVSKEISSGLGVALLTISLYFPSELVLIFNKNVIVCLFTIWLFLILFFLFSTYRLLNLF